MFFNSLSACHVCSFVACSLVLAAIIRWITMRRKLYLLSWQLPGPTALPFVGNVCPKIQDLPRLVKRFEEETKKYSSPYRLWVGSKLVVVFTDPDQIRSLLTEIYVPGKPGLYYYWALGIGTGLLTGHGGGNWRRNRLQMNAAFDNFSITSHQTIVNKQAKKMAAMMKKLVGAEGNKDIALNSMRMCFDIITETLLKEEDARFQEDNMDPLVKNLHKISAIAQRRITNCLWHCDYMFKSYSEDYGFLEKAKAELRFFVKDIFNRRKQEFLEAKKLSDRDYKEKDAVKTPIDIMLQAQYTGNRPFDNEIMEEINNLYQAGVDPTASTLSFFLLVLATHSEIQDRLYNEIASQYGGKKPEEVTIEDLSRFKYLDMCMNEVMRMFPGTAFIAREVTEDVLMDDGTFLPSGVNTLIPSYMLNMSPRYWKDPNIFDPERFTPENSEGRHPYLFLPYGAGPRNCIGQQLGSNIVKTAIIHLVSSYTFHTDVALKDISLYIDLITIKPEKGYPLQVRVRKN